MINDGDHMLYNILGIIVGSLLLIHSLFLIFSVKPKKVAVALNLTCAAGLIGTGIGGFFIPKALDYIVIILLLFFSIIFLVVYSVFLKERKQPQRREVNSRKE